MTTTTVTTPPVFTGVGVALVTLFDADGEVDVSATVEHAVRLVDLGVQAVVVTGTTGEAAGLDLDERRVLWGAVRERVGERVPVLAGTGAASARQAVRMTETAVETGVHAVLVLPPPRSTNPAPYFREVAAAAGGLPVLAYHFPAVAAPGVAVDQLAELPIVGVKDSSGDPDRLLATLEAFDRSVYVGSSAILALAGPLGCTGAILALANAEPERCIDAFGGDAKAQRALAVPHLAAKRTFPGGLKQLVAERFGTSALARLG